MKSYCYRIPFPPSVNNYIKRGNNRSYMTKRGKEFRAEVIASLWPLKGGGTPGGPEGGLDGRLAINIELTLPDRRKRDIDNHIKAVLDALQHAYIFRDDSQIDELRVKRLHVEAPGACDVTICELSPTSPPTPAAGEKL